MKESLKNLAWYNKFSARLLKIIRRSVRLCWGGYAIVSPLYILYGVIKNMKKYSLVFIILAVIILWGAVPVLATIGDLPASITTLIINLSAFVTWLFFMQFILIKQH